MNNGILRAAKAFGGLFMIAVVAAAFLLKIWRGQPVPGWLVILVTTLGLAAGAAILGREAIELAAELRE